MAEFKRYCPIMAQKNEWRPHIQDWLPAEYPNKCIGKKCAWWSLAGGVGKCSLEKIAESLWHLECNSDNS